MPKSEAILAVDLKHANLNFHGFHVPMLQVGCSATRVATNATMSSTFREGLSRRQCLDRDCGGLLSRSQYAGMTLNKKAERVIVCNCVRIQENKGLTYAWVRLQLKNTATSAFCRDTYSATDGRHRSRPLSTGICQKVQRPEPKKPTIWALAV